MIVDVHAHLEICKNIPELIENAKQANVAAIIASGSTIDANRKVLEFAEKYDIVQPALGLYPVDALELSDEEIESEIEFIKKSKPAAISEIGLEYQETDDRERQQIVFEKFLNLAKELNIPAIVHSRKAETEVIATLKKLEMKKVVLHAFHGNMKLVKEGAESGFLFSIPTNVTRSSHCQSMVQELPIKNIMTETDAPFLAATPGVPSEPAHIQQTIEHIAEIKGLNAEETSKMLFMNYQRLF